MFSPAGQLGEAGGEWEGNGQVLFTILSLIPRLGPVPAAQGCAHCKDSPEDVL